MRKRTACVVAAILSASLAISGCGLLPFEQDVPFQKSDSENTDVKDTEETQQQTSYVSEAEMEEIEHESTKINIPEFLLKSRRR